jgi:putative Mn2+ efflux pump MntP
VLRWDCGAFFAVGIIIGAFWQPDEFINVFAAAGAFLILGIGAAYIYYKVKMNQDDE